MTIASPMMQRIFIVLEKFSNSSIWKYMVREAYFRSPVAKDFQGLDIKKLKTYSTKVFLSQSKYPKVLILVLMHNLCNWLVWWLVHLIHTQLKDNAGNDAPSNLH